MGVHASNLREWLPEFRYGTKYANALEEGGLNVENLCSALCAGADELDRLNREGTETCPYWAHYAMANALRKQTCLSPRTWNHNGHDCMEVCTSQSSLCITEYCPSCYARVWWESQHKHKAQRDRAKTPRK